MTTWIVGDLLTGRRIQTLPVVSGSWSDVLNDSGSISCTVSLRDPDVARLGLSESARPGKAFLAVVDGSTVLQAGPIWSHDWTSPTALTLTGAGMWSYFDHRFVLPVLADGVLPTDPSADTSITSSLQGVARGLVAQAQAWTDGDVPVVLPTAISGTNVREYRGADLTSVGQRLRELTQVDGGPDIRFQPRLTTDLLGVEWVMLIGTPTEPLLFSAVEPVFTLGVPGSPVDDFRVRVDGNKTAGRVYASGGRASDEALVAVGTNSSLSAAGFPLLEIADSSRATITDVDTLQGFATELALRGDRTVETWSFSHRTDQRPFLEGYAVGDFAKVRVIDDLYVPAGEHRLRILSRSGDAVGRVVSVKFQPELS